MPSPAHETLVALLSQRPDLLDRLLRTLGHAGIPAEVVPVDSALRVANPLEVRPDLLLVAEGERGPWVILEVQLQRDDEKRRRWLAASGVLLDTRGFMGDVVVITHDASVARWAAEVARTQGPGGTRLSLEPVVVTLTLREAEVLLAARAPELAVFAAWAVHDQRGRDAQEIVRAVVAEVDAVPDMQLRDTLSRAIISMLGDDLLAVIEEMMMERLEIPESPGFKALRRKIEAIGEARGEARALLTVLSARRLMVDDAARARIEGCDDAALLNRWIERAATAKDLDEVFGPAGDAE
ncbi:MAG: hypothetical protein U0325_12615 [Polyangiales bacterium]